MGPALLPQEPRGAMPKLGVEERHHGVSGRSVPVAPGLEEARQLASGLLRVHPLDPHTGKCKDPGKGRSSERPWIARLSR
jgi:hypothetical protein